MRAATLALAAALSVPCRHATASDPPHSPLRRAGLSAPSQVPGPPAAPEQYTLDSPLTVDQAVAAGLRHNPQTSAAASGVAAARYNYLSVAAQPGVQLGATHVEGTSAAPTLNGNTSDTYIDLGEVFDTSGQRRYQAAGLRQQLDWTRYQYLETRITLAQQIRDAYWTLVAAQAQAAAAREILADETRVQALTRIQEAAGAAPRADVVRSSIDVANARQAQITAEAQERSALAALNALLYRPPFAPVSPSVALSDTSQAPQTIEPDLAALTRQALAKRPLIRSARALVAVARYGVLQARASRLPDLSFDYERSLQQPNETYILGIRLPILDFGAIHNAVRSAQATQQQAAAQEHSAEEQVAQQVAQACTDYQQAMKLAASARTEVLEPSITLLGMAQLGYKQGGTGILPVIDAETTLRNARQSYISSLLAIYKAQDEILAATGEAAPPESVPDAASRPSR